MVKKLKIRIVKFERAIAIQVLEQEGYFARHEHIKSIDSVEIKGDALYLRGSNPYEDYAIGQRSFRSNEVRDKFIQDLLNWISEEQFSTDVKVVIGETCLVSNFPDEDCMWVERKLLGILPKNYSKPYITENINDENKISFWKEAKPLNKYKFTADGEIYTWELEK